jgi:hypothetical protein
MTRLVKLLAGLSLFLGAFLLGLMAAHIQTQAHFADERFSPGGYVRGLLFAFTAAFGLIHKAWLAGTGEGNTPFGILSIFCETALIVALAFGPASPCVYSWGLQFIASATLTSWVTTDLLGFLSKGKS